MTSKKKSIWFTYDLGLRENYQALFTFLDNHNIIAFDITNPSFKNIKFCVAC
jgi:hypothetical protein